MSTDALARVRRICLALPEAWEKEAWGEPTFRVKKRLFAMYDNHHHGSGHIALWCNAPLGVQEHLVRSEPEKYFVPPYVGVNGWIGIVLDRVDDAELEAQVVQSYCMVAPRKLQALVTDPTSRDTP
ncbi:MAG TPA: MmcQ/YjbR family DNA-binding protein [Longimicrobiaceae bacterium]|nr:MmcQ/YjbR family DNA-binding protein [Longimicrobiaceae bacterium]